MDKTILSLVIVYLSLTAICISNVFGQDKTITPDEWEEDLQFVIEKIKQTHPQPFFKIAEDSFVMATKNFSDNIPKLSDNEIVAGLLHLTSLLEDGHTRLHGKNLTKLWFPIRITEFRDGFYITVVPRKHVEVIGAKVLKIGNYSTDVAFEKIKAITPSDNKYSQSYYAPIFVMMSSIMKGLHIIDDPTKLDLQIEIDGKISELSIVATNYNSDNDFTWFWLFNGVPDTNYVRFIDLNRKELPLVYKNLEQYYWFEYLEEYKTVYMCFNLCMDSENEKFFDFCHRLWDFVENKDVDRLIIDLRNNIGGNNQILLPLIHGAIKHDKINKPGHLFVVVGRKTWSAAMHCATWFERHTNANFLGEPTGTAPNHYADPESYILPNSKLTLLVSKYYWQNSWPWDDRPWIEPEQIISISSADYFEGYDPVLDAILRAHEDTIKK
jgi:hypothetical protein